MFYLAGHAVTKSVLFLAAGAMIAASGKKNISELAGIGRKMPVTMAAFTVGSLGLTGIPLFSGFVGKWYLILGSLESGSFFPSVIIIVGSVLCAAYLFSVVRVVYFEPAPDENWKDRFSAENCTYCSCVGCVGFRNSTGSFSRARGKSRGRVTGA